MTRRKRGHHYFVYMMSNEWRNVIYTGVTNNLLARAYQHRNSLVPGFTSRYQITRLVYFEQSSDVYTAIAREKQIKAGNRAKKIALIESQNPNWNDLYDKL